ncbi:hypothetical protein LCGC14_2453310 [marine sediment metagenome]|uniref:Uncharacterized protein n=1 Tax=marine sediment metagenome TaxID=412755 RepID=A0A0F9DSJ5_9ZZZZ
MFAGEHNPQIGITTACALNTLYELNQEKALELYKQKKDRRFIELVIKEKEDKD